MGLTSRFYGATDNFRAMEQWLNLLNQQSAGSVTPGAKALRATFTGGQTETSPGGQIKVAENRLHIDSGFDFSQGQVTSSFKDSHLAVRGEGFYAVARTLNAGEPVVYTRDGEFTKDANGLFRDKMGNYLLSAMDIDPDGNVVRDPAQFGRFGDIYGPGGVGVTEKNFYNAAIAGVWQDPLTGGSPTTTSTVFQENFNAVVVGTGGPSPTQWMATARTTGFNDVAWGGPNASGRSVGWSASTYGQNGGAGNGLYYGDQNSGLSYSTGIEAAQTLDIMANWGSAPLTDVDLNISEAGGGTVNGGNPLGQGWSLRDQANGLRPGGGVFGDWDEHYHLDTRRPTGFTPGLPTYNATYDDYTNGVANYGGVNSNDGVYTASLQEFSGNGATVDWQVVEDAGGVRATTTTGTTNLAAGGSATIGSYVKADRRNQGEVTSPEYNLGGVNSVGTVTWDQKSMVEAGANLDTMSFSYRLDGGAWTTVPVNVKALTGNNGNWNTISPINLTGLAGANTIQFKWNFDTVDSKANNTFGWAIDNFNFTAQGATATPSQLRFNVIDANNVIPPGAVIELLDAAGGLLGSAPVGSSPLGVNVTIPVIDNPFPAPSKWPLPAGVVRIRAGVNILDSHSYSNLLADAFGQVTLSGRRGFEASLFTGPTERLRQSPMGAGYFEPISFTDVPFQTMWGTNGAGKIIRNALEDSNSPVQRIGQELQMAKTIYGNLTKVIQARTMNLDSLLSIVK